MTVDDTDVAYAAMKARIELLPPEDRQPTKDLLTKLFYLAIRHFDETSERRNR